MTPQGVTPVLVFQKDSFQHRRPITELRELPRNSKYGPSGWIKTTILLNVTQLPYVTENESTTLNFIILHKVRPGINSVSRCI